MAVVDNQWLKGSTKQMPGFRWNKARKEAYFDVRAPDGSRHRDVKPFGSVEDARLAFVAYRAKIAKASRAAQSEVKTFSDFFEQHWQSMRGRTKERTFKQDTTNIVTHLLPFFGDDAIEDLTELRIEEFISHAKGRTDARGHPKPLAPATINYCLRMLRKLMHGMRKRKLLSDVPKMPFEKEPIMRNEFSEEEQDAYLAAFDDEDGFMRYIDQNRRFGEAKTCGRYPTARIFGASLKPYSDAAKVYFSRFRESKVWFLTALHTGLRRGDVTTLKWSSVNLRDGFIRVTVQKTGREATVPMSATLRVALLERKNRTVVSEFVIISSDGRPYADSVIKNYHQIAKAIAGITRRVRIHDLRHSFGSRLASAGASELMLKDFFGHESTRMVARYSRPSAASMMVISAALDRTGGLPNGHQIGHQQQITKETLICDQQPDMNKATVTSGLASI